MSFTFVPGKRALNVVPTRPGSTRSNPHVSGTRRAPLARSRWCNDLKALLGRQEFSSFVEVFFCKKSATFTELLSDVNIETFAHVGISENY